MAGRAQISGFPPVILFRQLFFRAACLAGPQGATPGHHFAPNPYKTSPKSILGRQKNFRQLFFPPVILFAGDPRFCQRSQRVRFPPVIFRQLFFRAACIWPDCLKYSLTAGPYWDPRSPFNLLLAGPAPGRSPQARAQPARPGLAPAQPGPDQNAKMARGAGK